MIIRYIAILFIVFFISCADRNEVNTLNQQTDDLSSKNNAVLSDAPIGSTRLTFKPLTQEFFDNFMDSKQEFALVRFAYAMGIDSEHLDAKQQSLTISMQPKYGPKGYADYFINQNLSQIASFNCYYLRIDRNSYPKHLDYKCQLSPEIILPLFEIIQQNGEYLFDAAEYQGAASVDYGSHMQFGHRNGVSLDIQQPDQILHEPDVYYTFSKRWDPGDDPPEELMPVINYLENTIIPLVKEHPIQF